MEGNISPLTPSTTPPLPQQQLHPTVVNMEVEGQVRNYNALAMSQNQSTPSIYMTYGGGGVKYIFIALYYRQLSADIKIKILSLKLSAPRG